MVIGLRGEVSKLKNLYKELGLKEVKPNSFDELNDAIKNSNGDVVISNYNDLMVFEAPTADLVEKRTAIVKTVSKAKKNIFLGLNKNDPSLDKIALDVAICTKVDTKDMELIKSIFLFCNTDLPYNGNMKDDNYAVKSHNDLRAREMTLSELKKILK